MYVFLVAQRLKHLPGMQETQFDPWVGKIPWRRKWQPTPVLLPGESHGGRILVGYSPWGRKELDTTERLHFHFLFFQPGYSLQVSPVRRGSYPSVVSIGTKHRVHRPLERQPSMISMNRPKMESRPSEFLFHSPLLMFLISVMSIIYCDILYPSPLATHMREHAINLWVTKFTRHCKKQGPQSSMIRTIITTVTIVFHQSPFTQDRTKVQKGIFSSDMAFT